MNYIGRKFRLLEQLTNSFFKIGSTHNKVFCDLFAGTGTVGSAMKSYVKKVIANDVEYYAYILNKCYIENGENYELSIINAIEPVEGLIYQNYCSPANRLYFTDLNGKKIDGIRQYIEEFKDTEYYYVVLTALLEAVDRIQNTTGLYAAYLKKIKRTAQQHLFITEPNRIFIPNQENIVYQQDANELIKNITGDILYLDPPYNRRQYGTNYHLLNVIANYKLPDEMNTITGSPKRYFKSNWCYASTAQNELQHIIEHADFPHIFLSYNNEGILSKENIISILERYGKTQIQHFPLRTYKADTKRNNKSDQVVEYLFYLKKQ